MAKWGYLLCHYYVLFNIAGAVYLFISLADGLWSQTQRLVASAAGAYDAFGCALSIHGNVLTVGARAADIAALNAGGYIAGLNSNLSSLW